MSESTKHRLLGNLIALIIIFAIWSFEISPSDAFGFVMWCVAGVYLVYNLIFHTRATKTVWELIVMYERWYIDRERRRENVR